MKVVVFEALAWGALDKLPIPSLAARIEDCRRVRPDVKITVVPYGGHWIQYDQPHAINAALIDFHLQA